MNRKLLELLDKARMQRANDAPRVLRKNARDTKRALKRLAGGLARERGALIETTDPDFPIIFARLRWGVRHGRVSECVGRGEHGHYGVTREVRGSLRPFLVVAAEGGPPEGCWLVEDLAGLERLVDVGAVELVPNSEILAFLRERNGVGRA